MKKTLLFIIAFCCSSVWAQSNLVQINPNFDNGTMTLDMEFDRPVKKENVNIEYINQTVQVSLKGAHYPFKKNLNKINKENVKSVFTYQVREGLLRTRVIYKKPVQAKMMRDFTTVKTEGNKVIIKIEGSKVLPVKKSVEKKVSEIELPVVPPMDIEKELQELAQAEDTKLEISKESEIPVLAMSKKKVTQPKSLYYRVLMSVFVVLLLGGSLIWFSKWWSKNNKTNKDVNKIRVMTQHYIGPKKSLAIVRVAGEFILIGVTDQNISMLKTLSLIDDEYTEGVASDFSETLKQADSTQDKVMTHKGVAHKEMTDAAQITKKKMSDPMEAIHPIEDFSMGNIKDIVSTKLKNMRTL